VEVPAVRELLPEAQVEALDNSVLLGAASIDIDRLDTLFGLWFDARRPLDNYWTRRGVIMQNLPNPAKAEAPFYWGFASKVAERMGFEGMLPVCMSLNSNDRETLRIVCGQVNCQLC
jgi:hypothetical protein